MEGTGFIQSGLDPYPGQENPNTKDFYHSRIWLNLSYLHLS